MAVEEEELVHNRQLKRELSPRQYKWYSTTAAGFIAGSSLGVLVGGREAANRFRLERLHQPPQSRLDMYLYLRERNYQVLVGGLKKGFNFGGRLALVSAIFASAEVGLDYYREESGFVNVLAAGTVTGLLLGIQRRIETDETLDRTGWKGVVKGTLIGAAFGTVAGLLYEAAKVLERSSSTDSAVESSRKPRYGTTDAFIKKLEAEQELDLFTTSKDQ